MFLIDDILLFPMTGTLRLVHAIESAAEEETAKSADAVRTELAELYGMLETGRVSSDEFDAREKELLDRLDAVESRQAETEPSENKT